jgi:hypothetical protein
MASYSVFCIYDSWPKWQKISVTSSSFLIKLLDVTAESIGGLYKLSGGWSGALFLKKVRAFTYLECP